MPIPDKCPMCGAGNESIDVQTQHIYGDKRGDRAFFYCQSCDIRFIFPALSKEEEKKFYLDEFEQFMENRSGTSVGWKNAEKHIKSNEKTRERRMRYVQKHIFPGAALLEVGCSSGFMLLPFQKKGHKCVGIEPSGLFSDYLKKQGMTVYPSLDSMQVSEPDRKFDIINHFFVLEHISNPLSFLKVQLDLLNDGGKIIFEIPNAADPLFSVYDIPAFERFYWSIAHHWYFSEISLKYVLEQLGKPFQIVLDQRYDLSNHMTWARDGKPGGMGRFTHLLGSDMEANYKRELIRNRTCDTLIAIINND